MHRGANDRETRAPGSVLLYPDPRHSVRAPHSPTGTAAAARTAATVLRERGQSPPVVASRVLQEVRRRVTPRGVGCPAQGARGSAGASLSPEKGKEILREAPHSGNHQGIAEVLYPEDLDAPGRGDNLRASRAPCAGRGIRQVVPGEERCRFLSGVCRNRGVWRAAAWQNASHSRRRPSPRPEWMPRRWITMKTIRRNHCETIRSSRSSGRPSAPRRVVAEGW